MLPPKMPFAYLEGVSTLLLFKKGLFPLKGPSLFLYKSCSTGTYLDCKLYLYIGLLKRREGVEPDYLNEDPNCCEAESKNDLPFT